MSDNWISLVPADPYWRPKADGLVARVVESARSHFPEAEEVEAALHDQPKFVHPGANLESVSCPSCDSDLTGWWEETMDDAWDDGFGSLLRTVPCCGKELSLNDLKYDWPAAFGVFQIDAMNPNLPDAPLALLAEIETACATPFRVVRTHI